MKIIDGVKTNLGGNYSFSDGNDKKTMEMRLPKDFRETDEEMFNRLKYCYSRITFYYVTTAGRGYYEIIAYCK